MRKGIQCGTPPAETLHTLAERVYATAFEALEQDQLEAAERYFALLALLAPRDERAWIGLAVSRERQEDWSMAAARYLVGTALVPDSTWCHVGRARALSRLGRFVESEQAFDDASACADDDALLTMVDGERRAS
jgi:tetratricopeptide (TPR) repeat protein